MENCMRWLFVVSACRLFQKWQKQICTGTWIQRNRNDCEFDVWHEWGETSDAISHSSSYDHASFASSEFIKFNRMANARERIFSTNSFTWRFCEEYFSFGPGIYIHIRYLQAATVCFLFFSFFFTCYVVYCTCDVFRSITIYIWICRRKIFFLLFMALPWNRVVNDAALNMNCFTRISFVAANAAATAAATIFVYHITRVRIIYFSLELRHPIEYIHTCM